MFDIIMGYDNDQNCFEFKHFLIFPGMPKPQTNDEDSIAAEDN